MMTAAIQAKGVRFAYRETGLFENLGLSIEPGEMVAVIGPNGSGKTTMLRLLSGALRPSAGELLLEGRPLTSLSPREKARRIALVPQESRMTFDFTVMETVLMGRTPYLGILGMEGPDDVSAAEGALRDTGMLGFSSRLLSQLSGGERQLALIARALAQRPRILLLDEPTAFLDIRHRRDIYRLLRRLNRERGLTIVTTSHDINLAARYCRRMILMKEGRLHADGRPVEIFDPATLESIYDTPLRVLEDPESRIPYAIPPIGEEDADS